MARIRASLSGGGGGALDTYVDTISTGSAQTISCGFEPKHIAIINSSTASKLMVLWDSANGNSYLCSGSGGTTYWQSITDAFVSGRNMINNVTSTGFTFSPSNNTTYHIFVVG